MIRNKITLLLLVIMLSMVACTPAADEPAVQETPAPIMTETTMPTATIAATETAVATPTTAPTATVTLRPTPTPDREAQPETDRPPETILIHSPGPGSQITSPVTVTGVSDYAFEGTLQVDVVAIDGETVGTGFALLNVDEIGQRGAFSGEVSFTPPAAPTQGRLSVYMTSARDGHIMHLASAPVTLLPEGKTPVVETAESDPETTSEAITILTPEANATLSGGTIIVSGFAQPTFEQNLVIEVLDENGNTISQAATIINADIGQAGPYETTVEYTIADEQHGAVCVQATDAATGGLQHRNCVNITLAP